MKQFSTLLALVLLAALRVSAQQSAVYDYWEVPSVGISLGGDIEMPHGLDYSYLLSTAKDVDFDFGDLPFTKGTLVSMKCDNPTLRLSLSLLPPGMKNMALQLSLLSIEGRIDKVYYEIPEGAPGGFQRLEVSAVNKETALEGSWLLRQPMGKSFTLHAGAGMNVGYSHDGKVEVNGLFREESQSIPTGEPVVTEMVETYDQREGINQRIFLQAGVGVKFLKRMEFGLELRKGYGYRAVFDGPFTLTTLQRSIGFSLKYSLI